MKITKEQVLENIDEVKKYIEEADNKKEETVKGIAIKDRFTGEIIFQSTKTVFKDAVEEAVEKNANLRNANLENAKFYGRGGTKVLRKSQVETFLKALGFIIED